MTKEKAPSWNGDPPPGFGPDGESMILPPGSKVNWPEQKIIQDGKEYTVAEWEAKEASDGEADDNEDDE